MVCVTCSIKVLTWIATCGPLKVRESEIASNPLRLVAFSRKPQLHQVNSSTSLCSQCSKESCCFQTRWCLGTEIVGSCQCLVVVFWVPCFIRETTWKTTWGAFCSKDSQLFPLFLLPLLVSWYPKLTRTAERSLENPEFLLQNLNKQKSQHQSSKRSPAKILFTKTRDRWQLKHFFKCSPLGEDVNPIWLAQGD